MAELNSRVRLGFQFCSVVLDLRERGEANHREDFIPSRFLSLYRLVLLGQMMQVTPLFIL